MGSMIFYLTISHLLYQLQRNRQAAPQQTDKRHFVSFVESFRGITIRVWPRNFSDLPHPFPTRSRPFLYAE